MSRLVLEADFRLPEITHPLMAPAALTALLEEYTEQNRQGNVEEAVARLRDILGFSVRYFAGVGQAIGRELGCLSAEETSEWLQGPTVAHAEQILVLCLERLQARTERVARKFCQVFVDADQSRPFARTLGLGADRPPEGPSLVTRFTATDAEEAFASDQLLDIAAAADGWMMASFSFFLECEQRLEPGVQFGQLEHAVQFEQYLLKTGLSVRVRQARTPYVQLSDAPEPEPEPAPEPPAEKKGSGPLSLLSGVKRRLTSGRHRKVKPAGPPPDPEVTEAPTVIIDTRKLDWDLIRSGKTSEEETPALALPSPDAREAQQRAAPLADLVDTLLQAPVVASRPQKTDATVDVPRPRVEVQVDYLGFVKNSRGKPGYGGHLWVRNVGDGELKGTVVSHHPDIEIGPTLIDGNETRFVYWVSPDQVGSSEGHIQVKTEHEDRRVPTWRLMPRSWCDGIAERRLAGLLLAPGLLGMLYCIIVFFFTSRWAQGSLESMLGASYARYLSTDSPLSLRQSGVGSLDLQIIPRIEASVLVFFLLTWIVPTVVARLYQSYPRHAQVDLSTLFTFAMMLPSVLFAALAYTSFCTGPVFSHPELSFLDFRTHLVNFAVLNLAVSGYHFLKLSGFWRRYLNALGRWTLALLLFGIYLAVLAYLIYGRSWGMTG